MRTWELCVGESETGQVDDVGCEQVADDIQPLNCASHSSHHPLPFTLELHSNTRKAKQINDEQNVDDTPHESVNPSKIRGSNIS